MTAKQEWEALGRELVDSVAARMKELGQAHPTAGQWESLKTWKQSVLRRLGQIETRQKALSRDFSNLEQKFYRLDGKTEQWVQWFRDSRDEGDALRADILTVKATLHSAAKNAGNMPGREERDRVREEIQQAEESLNRLLSHLYRAPSDAWEDEDDEDPDDL